MCIDVEDLNTKINEPSVMSYSDKLCACIEGFFDALSTDGAEDKILDIFLSYEYIHTNKAAYSLLDTLRYAFDGIAYGGLHQLYTRQENEGWYPKIKLINELKPNDIDTLPEIITIYRGCSNAEHQIKDYGQAWSTSKTVAERFAFKHYQGQEWFVESERVVLKATIPKPYIFYSKQSGEFEVAVDTEYLMNIEKCTQ